MARQTSETKPRFIWVELMTSDPERAEAFYRAVIGWKTEDSLQPDMRYTILSAEGRAMGGVMEIPGEAEKAGARPAWLGYIGVPDTDLAAKRIAETGGAIHRGPDDIPNVGRFAVVSDPGGALFQLLTPIPPEDPPPPLDPTALGMVSWHELCAGNGQDAAFEFYAEHFGWETRELLDMGAMGKYRIFSAGGDPLGGMMDKPPQAPLACWNFYINVEAIDAAADRIASNGGQVVRGPDPVPGDRWTIQAVDPQGAMFALVSDRR